MESSKNKNTQIAPDDIVEKISQMLIKKNLEAYKALAKGRPNENREQYLKALP